MKRLLTLLITKGEGTWWRLRESTGDPPEEREYMFIFQTLVTIIKHKLTREKSDHEIHS